jgi:hypothetical protein
MIRYGTIQYDNTIQYNTILYLLFTVGPRKKDALGPSLRHGVVLGLGHDADDEEEVMMMMMKMVVMVIPHEINLKWPHRPIRFERIKASHGTVCEGQNEHNGL